MKRLILAVLLPLLVFSFSWKKALPYDSYTASHYAPGLISYGVGYQTTQLLYDVFWYEANPYSRDWVCFWAGFATTIAAQYLLRNHYENEDELLWFHQGRGHGALFYMTINIIRIPIHNRNQKKKVATMEKWKTETIEFK